MLLLRIVFFQCIAGLLLVLLLGIVDSLTWWLNVQGTDSATGGENIDWKNVVSAFLGVVVAVLPNGVMSLLLLVTEKMVIEKLGLPAQLSAMLFMVYEGVKVVLSIVLLVIVGMWMGKELNWLILLPIYAVLLFYPAVYMAFFHKLEDV